MSKHRARKLTNQNKTKYKPKFRSGFGQTATLNSRKPYIQAHINFFDTNTNDDAVLKMNKYDDMPAITTNGRQNKWPNLSRLQSQLHQDIINEELPPYIKKYNRRNKQLINLLEGTISPSYQDMRKKPPHVAHRRRQKSMNKWIENNLFEDQKPNVAFQMHGNNAMAMAKSNGDQYMNSMLSKNKQSAPNALPGEHLSISAEYDVDEDRADASEAAKRVDGNNFDAKKNLLVAADAVSTGKLPSDHPNYQISPKADKFLFHRVASPKLVGTGMIGNGFIKQRLPFVAITDKQLGEAKRHVDVAQNTLPLP